MFETLHCGPPAGAHRYKELFLMVNNVSIMSKVNTDYHLHVPTLESWHSGNSIPWLTMRPNPFYWPLMRIQIKTLQKFQHTLLLLRRKASGVLFKKHRPTVFLGIGFPIIKVTKSWDCLILMTVILINAIYFLHWRNPRVPWEHIYTLNSDCTPGIVSTSKIPLWI